MNFDQAGETQRVRTREQFPELPIVERGHNQEHGIRAVGHGFCELVLRDDEVFPQELPIGPRADVRGRRRRTLVR
jgi:hypothetical protein